MSFALKYCPQGKYILPRLHTFYNDRSQDLILASMGVPSKILREFKKTHPSGYCNYPNPLSRITFWDNYLAEHMKIQDDSIPSAYLSEMDQGLYGALVGGKPHFMYDADTGWVSSMVEPILKDWSEFGRLKIDETNAWFHKYIRQLKIFVEKSAGRFGISHFILINGLNFVFELRGATQTYIDLMENPELVQKAIDFALELNLLVQKKFFDLVPLLENGTCSNMAQWISGKIISESVDPFHMTSVDYFEQWGRKSLEKILAEFDGGVLHIHGNGRHLLKAISTVKGLKAVFLGDDKDFPPAFEVLPQLKKYAGDLPFIVSVNFADFAQALQEHRLTAGVFYQVTGVPDGDTANRCMDLVRQYKV